ncbi:TPA: [FeFe] hydrogenase H-cluster radical SAM maturase HydE [bacterium]|nr:[FeFe] hydrogenase H-cluster radical SAM maturase HydE [bacterium]
MSIAEKIDMIINKTHLSHDDIVFLLSLDDDEHVNRVLKHARNVANQYIGKKVYLRGLIEISNICSKNCYYCGIRKDNSKIYRYVLSKEEIKKAIVKIYEQGYGSVVIQSGENTEDDFIALVEDCIRFAHSITNSSLGITLSLGEQLTGVYKRWYDAGAHRYLLRIETSDPFLYKRLHPSDHSFEKRKECLNILKKIGYQAGTGVMIGLPHQTLHHLAGDILFFKEMDVDMIGMGPYIIHNDTPLGTIAQKKYNKEYIMRLSLLMIAVTRLVCKDCNIASTTALRLLDSTGIKGILAGANVMMPNVTPHEFRKNYFLYEGKENVVEDNNLKTIEEELNKYDIQIAYKEQGNPIHYYKRRNDKKVKNSCGSSKKLFIDEI